MTAYTDRLHYSTQQVEANEENDSRRPVWEGCQATGEPSCPLSHSSYSADVDTFDQVLLSS